MSGTLKRGAPARRGVARGKKKPPRRSFGDRILEWLQISEETLRKTVASLPAQRACACGRALDGAIVTERAAIPAEVRERLRPILQRVLA